MPNIKSTQMCNFVYDLLPKMPVKKSLALAVVFSSLALTAFSQLTSVRGRVVDSSTGEGIPFAHIYFKGTQTGATSDTTGGFHLQHNRLSDSLIVSCLGYHTQRLYVHAGKHQELTVSLRSQWVQLNEVQVQAGENPAWAILDKVIERKALHNPEGPQPYAYEEYSKIRFDLNHFTEKIKQNIMLRPFDFIWENVDTTADGVTYLPVLFVEKIIDHYYGGPSHKTREVIKATNTTGLKGPKIMKFLEDLYLTPNLYDNFVVLLEKNFPSPLHDNYKQHYQYTLFEDSTVIDGVTYYRILFQPKHKRELAFTGEMLVQAPSFAIAKIELRFDIMANVNFVRSYWVSQEYKPVDNQWRLTSSQVIGDFTVMENQSEMTGFFGRKNSTYSHYRLEQEIPRDLEKSTARVIETDSASVMDDRFWQASRPTALTKEEVGVFNMVHRLEEDPAFVARKNTIVALVTGYVPLLKTDVGDFYSFYSYNKVEHSRLKFGIRTSKKLSWPLTASAYGAYGTFDQRWKYGFHAEWDFHPSKQKAHRLGIAYRNDIDQLGRSFNNIAIDHVLTSFVQYGEVASRNYSIALQGYVENTWAVGLLSRLSYFQQSISPVADQIFYRVEDNGMLSPQSSYKATGISVTLKYSWQNANLNGDFYTRDDKKIVFRKYPDLSIEWRMADKDYFNSGINFQKINVMARQKVRMGKLGYLQYNVEAGKTFQTVPYPFLNIPFGNQLVFHDDMAFNLMNFLEYTSDEFVTAHVQHHFEGLILDRIPLVNRLKWRWFVFGRAWWGRLSESNNQRHYLFPSALSPLNERGYYEAGFGIENIFKIARVDFTWRLTDIHQPNVYYFIVKPSFRFAF